MNPAYPCEAADSGVLVTGATSGVGEATARLFAAAGSKVALLGRNAERLHALTEELGSRTSGVVADVASSADVDRAVGEAEEFLGGLDVVVNAAGIAAPALLEHLVDRVWDEVLATNLSGTFYVCRAAGIRMRRSGGGSIVNVASDLASMGAVGLAHYSASKAGVVGLTRALAVELAPEVRVNVVAPGPIDTPMLRAGIDAMADPALALAEKEGTVPLARLAQPAEVARAIRFLAIDGTFATGSVLAFDGGTTAA